MVFDEGVFGTRKTGRHPRVAETREDKQMAAAQEKRHSISSILSLSIWQCSFLSPLVLTLIIFHLSSPYLKRKEARCISINLTLGLWQVNTEGWLLYLYLSGNALSWLSINLALRLFPFQVNTEGWLDGPPLPLPLPSLHHRGCRCFQACQLLKKKICTTNALS